MTSQDGAQAELEALRAEVQELKRAREAAAAEASAPDDAEPEEDTPAAESAQDGDAAFAEPDPAHVAEGFDLDQTLHDIKHAIEEGVDANPVLTVLGAFALGLLIGRAMPR